MAICLSLLIVLGIFILAPAQIGIFERLPADVAMRILPPALLVFLLGLCDDIYGLGPYTKFAVQTLAAAWLYAVGLGIRNFDLFLNGHGLKVVVGLLLTVLWVQLITNAFNLIDGIDGLAAGSALFSTLVVFVVALLAGTHFIALLTIILAGAILGFLRFNFNPATIFLGDSGSLFIGFMLSALALVGSQKAPTMIAVAIPVVSFGLPILDVALATLRRFLNGRPLFKGDHEHIHHKLLKMGFSQREAVLILYGASAGFALLSLVLLHGAGTTGLVLVILGIGVSAGIRQLRYHEFTELGRILSRFSIQKRIITNDLYIRRATDSLSACREMDEVCQVLATTLEPLGFDGFGISFSSNLRRPESDSVLLPPEPNGELLRWWAKSDSTKPGWELRLKLISSGEECGFFSFYKRSASQPILMDLDLLANGFQVAVANAVRRSIVRVPQPAKPIRETLKARVARTVSASD